MRISRIIISLITIFFVASPAIAQKKKSVKRPAPKPAVVEEKTPGEILYEEMLPSTAKIMFVDSIVVNKEEFLKKILMSDEAGVLSIEHQNISYTNELGTTRYLTLGDTIKGFNIFSSMLIGESWSAPKPIPSIGSEYKNPCNPYLLTDGITLFFAAQGEKSIGGYDIFMTTYNNETASFYQPNNYGLPFNSYANEYLLAIDEFSNIGWLVSDRYQEEGNVCIYIFEPTPTRISLGSENLTEEQLKSLANLTSIKDSWKFGNRKQVLERLRNIELQKTIKKHEDDFIFYIDDNTIYTSKHQFKSKDALKHLHQLEEMNIMLKKNNEQLQQLQSDYRNSTNAKRRTLSNKILGLQADIDQLEIDIRNTEKNIRNYEILTINQ